MCVGGGGNEETIGLVFAVDQIPLLQEPAYVNSKSPAPQLRNLERTVYTSVDEPWLLLFRGGM